MDFCFINSLGINDCFDAGIYRLMHNYRERILIGSLSTVVSADMMAVLRGAELLVKKMMMRIHICSNSRAALAALSKTTTE
jgi:hypothetical protein